MTSNRPLGPVRGAVVALLAGLCALLLPSAAWAAPAPDPATVLASWRNGDPLFVQSGAPLSASDQEGIRNALKDAKTKIYAVALPDGTITTSQQAGSYITSLGQELAKAGRPSATVAVIDGTTLFAGSSALPKGAAGRIANLAAANNSGNPVAVMQDFVARVDAFAAGNRNEALRPGSLAGGGDDGGGDDGGGTGGLLAILGLAAIGGGGIWLLARRNKRKREEQEARELAAVKQTVEEDVTKFGEEITALDMDVKMLPQTADTTADWQRALDAYERAKAELAAVRRADDLRTVTATLEEGRYALACVKARVNNEPLPERLPPCFFNPQHGPSVRKVQWAPPGGMVREVPACAADADAVERGLTPQMREVVVDGHRRPYWDAGPAYQPYAYGYYGGFGDVMTGMLVGTMLGSMIGGGFGFGGFGAGYSAGYAEGLQDAGGGGGDWSGGGGGDWGGGGVDWGGGDFGGDFGGDW